MSLATNVFRRGGRYTFRARVPHDLVARFGRSEIIRSLKTTDPGMARRHASRVAASLYVLWDKVRSDLMLSRDRIDEIVRAYFHQILEEDQTFRLADLPEFDWKSDKDIVEALTLVSDKQEVDNALEESGEHSIHFTQDFLTKIAHANLKVALEINDWREAELFVGSLIKKHGLKVPKDSMEYRLLSHGVLRAMVEASRIILERSTGNCPGIGHSAWIGAAYHFRLNRATPERVLSYRLEMNLGLHCL